MGRGGCYEVALLGDGETLGEGVLGEVADYAEGLAGCVVVFGFLPEGLLGGCGHFGCGHGGR